MMPLRNRSIAFLLALLAATSVGAVGCSSSSDDDSDDGALEEVEDSGWTMNFAAVNQNWPETAFPVRDGHPEDAFSVLVDLGQQKIRANTHLFSEKVNLIPYANPNEEAQFASATEGKGDAVISKYIKPGEMGLMIKHHRPEHRLLQLQGAGPEMKEHFKLQDTHIGIIVGLERNGRPGAISINNPKNYEQGAFGTDHYPMVFVKPTFPAGVDAAMQKLYFDNIRAMAVLFNTVSVFPGDYNGGDPLAARNPDEIKRHVAMMVKAIGGDTNAQQWFTKPENKIYCAELAHVSFSAGILVPLSKRNLVGLQGDGLTLTEADVDTFISTVGSRWPFAQSPIPSADTGSPNPRMADLTNLRPDFAKLDGLRPISEIAQAPKRADGVPSKGLAFEPMTMADIVQHFLRTHIPRDPALQKGTELAGAGERVAAIQGQVLASMEEGLYESMKIPTTGPGSEQRQRAITDDAALMQLPGQLAQGQQVQFTVKDVFTALLKITGTSHASYQDFQKAVQPWLMVARKVTGPRGNSGEGLFAPPNLFHVIAQNAHPGGYLGLQYMGHGLHYKMLNAPAAGANAPAQEPPKEPQAPRFGEPGGGN